MRSPGRPESAQLNGPRDSSPVPGLTDITEDGRDPTRMNKNNVFEAVDDMRTSTVSAVSLTVNDLGILKESNCRRSSFGSVSATCRSVVTDSAKFSSLFWENVVTLMSYIYTIFVFTLGCILTITRPTFFYGNRNLEADEVFGTILCVLGLLWLVFLHVDIVSYKSQLMKLMKQQQVEHPDNYDTYSISTEHIVNSTRDFIDNNPFHRRAYLFLKGRHSGSFFLKSGMAVFCFVHLIHEVLLLGEKSMAWIKNPLLCSDITSVIFHAIHPLYSFLQLYVVFKYSNILINRHKIIAGIGLMHCIATALVFWFSTIVADARTDHFRHTILNNSIPEGVLADDVCSSIQFISAEYYAPFSYLYPFTIEFKILLAGIWFIVWQNIGHLDDFSTTADDNMHRVSYESNVVITADCHAANKGIFAGLFVLVLAVVSMIVFFLHPDASEIGLHIFNMQEGMLILVALLSSAAAFYKLSDLDNNLHPVTFLDDFLLFIPLPFYFANGILCLMADIIQGNIVRILLNVLVLLQVATQTPLIIAGLRRCSNRSILQYRKPGREVVTFLIIVNVTMWVVYTFEHKKVDKLLGVKDYYGEQTWNYVTHATFPLMLFYRFHAAVCLADIWKSAYEKDE